MTDADIRGRVPNGTTLRPPPAKTSSCQRKLASRIGLSADVFQTLDSGFRRNDGVIRGFSLKVVPLGRVPFSPLTLNVEHHQH